MKTQIKIFSVLILLAMAVAACAPAVPETVVETVVVKETEVVEVEVEKQVEVAKEVEVEKEVYVNADTVLYNSNQSDPLPREFDEKIVALWNEQHPEMQIEHSTVAHEDFKQAIRAYLTAEPSPDLLTWFAGNRARFFIDKGLIADFDDMWTEQGFDDVYGTGFQALATYNDGKYFLPNSYYWWAVYYRPSLFEEAGIESEPETWDEFLVAIDKLNAIGVDPITIGTRYRWTAAGWFDYLNMRVNGPQFHIDLMDMKESYTDDRVKDVFSYWNELFEHDAFIDNPAAYTWQEALDFMIQGEAAMYLIGMKESYTDDRVKDVFSYWNELFEHDAFIDNPAAYTWQEALDFMIQGEAAMYLIGGFMTDSYPDELEDDLDFFRFPIINPDVPIGEDAPTDGFFLSANATNLDGAKEVLAFIGSAEVQQMAFDDLGRLPTRTDVDISNASEAIQKGIDLILTADYIAQFYDRDTTPEMADAGMDGFMDFWDNPTQIDKILGILEEERLFLIAE